jgi:hypothetical protein
MHNLYHIIFSVPIIKDSDKKVKQSHNTHTYGGAGRRGGTAPTHSQPRHEMAGMVSITLRPPFYAGEKYFPIPIGQKAGWAPELVWTQTIEEKSSLPPPGIKS